MRLIRLLRRGRTDARGLAMIEFALALPLVLPLGVFGIELSNYAVTQMRLSQITLALADNASRVGADTSLNTQELREYDVNDVLNGARMQGANLDLGNRARITISSVEVNSKGGQYIHWQRCMGKKFGSGWDSTYGNEGDGATTTTFPGMGDSDSRVTAPPGSAVMFVEMNYEYQPLIASYMIRDTHLRFTASFLVRDNRDVGKGVTNPYPSSLPSLCALHNS